MAINHSKFLIFTDCGSQIGFGHFNRCNSIKTELELNNIEVLMEVYDDRNGSELRVDWKDSWSTLVDKYKVSNVLVDSFRVDENFFKDLIGLKKNIFVIDDFPERNYQEGTIINYTIGAESNSFLIRNPKVNYLLGAKYCCIRPEFYGKKYYKNYSKSNILVTFGGADIRQLSFPITKYLSTNYPEFNINLVLGSGAKKSDYSLFEKVMIHHDCDAEKMCQLMDDAQFAICGGGQTLYEMASRGLPPIIIPLIDNQLADIQGFVSRGFGLEALSWDQHDLLKSIDIAIHRILDSKTRANHSATGRKLIDGKGLKRLVSAIIKTSQR